MATTAIFPIHGGGRSVAKALGTIVDYMGNPDKTDDGLLISSYECAPETADLEFALSKKEYYSLTGKTQGKKDVLAYHVRQSFAPGEISPQEANRIGYELAQRFTKGRHAYIVCTHIDRAHIHNHIVWNSTALDCKKKFRNFLGSAFALRRCSDILCAENGLSVIENPKPSPGRDYGKWFSGKTEPSFKDRIKQAIDSTLEQNPATFEDFIKLIKAAGIKAERRGKHMRFKMPGQKQPARLDTLKGDYTEEAIRERIAGQRTVNASAKKPTAVIFVPEPSTPSLLIDIQAKLLEGKNAAYIHKSAVINLKQMAKTLIYLQERGLDDYGLLKEKTAEAKSHFNEVSGRLKSLDEKLTANTALQKHIVTYVKTRATYIEYRKAGYSKSFKATHEADILLHQAAKKFFDELGLKKLPTVSSLRTEYAPILEEKKRAYHEYKQAKTEMQELLTAEANVKRLLNINEHRTGHEAER